MNICSFIRNLIKEVAYRKNPNIYLHNYIENKIVKMNIKRLMPVSAVLIFTIFVIFTFNAINGSRKLPMLIFYLIAALIVMMAILSIIFAYRIEKEEIRYQKLLFFNRVYWFFIITMLSIAYLLDAYSTGKMFSLFAIYFLIATIPLFKFKDLIILLMIPNLMTLGIVLFEIMTVREYAYTLVIYNFLAILMSLTFYKLIYRFVESEKQLQDANKKLEIIAITDPLTGTKNRLGLDQAFNELKNLKVKPKKLNAISIDIDFFKSFNDTFGHAKGDECLMSIAIALTYIYNGEAKAIARTGGEEFAILLIDKDDQELLDLTNKLMRKIANLGFTSGNKSVSDKITISCGIASMNYSDSISWNDLYERSDSALYQAKKIGRNKIVLYQEIING